MLTTFNGLPAHVLFLHVVVVLIPVAAVMLLLSVAWPAARRRLGVVTPVVAFVGLVFVPLTTHAGEWLRNRLYAGGVRDPAIANHARMGVTLLPFAAGLFVLAALVWWLGRRDDRAAAAEADPAAARDGDAGTVLVMTGEGAGTAVLQRARTTTPAWVTVVVTALSVAAAVGSVVQLYRIGDSGAHAAWDYVQHLQTK